MARERDAEYKPLSFSTTMRNPSRIADFLKCILPYEGQVLTNEIIMNVATSLIKKKLYRPMYIGRTPRLKSILNEEREFTDLEVNEIYKTVLKITKKLVLIKAGLLALIRGINCLWSSAFYITK